MTHYDSCLAICSYCHFCLSKDKIVYSILTESRSLNCEVFIIIVFLTNILKVVFYYCFWPQPTALERPPHRPWLTGVSRRWLQRVFGSAFSVYMRAISVCPFSRQVCAFFSCAACSFSAFLESLASCFKQKHN